MRRAPMPMHLYARSKANGSAHRVLRNLARKAKTVTDVKTALNRDGYSPLTHSSVASQIYKLTLNGLLTVMDGTDDSDRAVNKLYEITVTGLTALAALEAKEAPNGKDLNPTPKPSRAVLKTCPAANPEDTHLLTTRQRIRAASDADLAPAAPRPGSDTALSAPSRIGNRLHYRDGRITAMDGTTLKKARSS